MSRDPIPNRRQAWTVKFHHEGMRYHATYSLFEDGPRAGQLREVFLVGSKPGSPVHAMCRDAGLVTSIALQLGATAAGLLGSLSKLDHGEAAGPVGTALEEITKAEPQLREEKR